VRHAKYDILIWEIKADLLREQWSLKNFLNKIDGIFGRGPFQFFSNSFEGVLEVVRKCGCPLFVCFYYVSMTEFS
jgi:hypothetical protein